MKTSIKTVIASTLTALVLVSATVTLKAAEIIKPAKSYQTVIGHFMDSYKNTNSKQLKEILDKNAVFLSSRNEQVIKSSSSDVLDFMRKNEGVKQQDCNLSYEIISETDAMVIVRVDVEYNLFEGVQQQFLTIENKGNGDWKITQVYKVFAPAKQKDALAQLNTTEHTTLLEK